MSGPSVAPRGHEILTPHTYCPACSGHGTDRHECVKSSVTVDRADLKSLLEDLPFHMFGEHTRDLITRMWDKLDD